MIRRIEIQHGLARFVIPNDLKVLFRKIPFRLASHLLALPAIRNTCQRLARMRQQLCFMFQSSFVNVLKVTFLTCLEARTSDFVANAIDSKQANA